MPACSYVNPLGSPAPLLSTPAHRQSSSGSAEPPGPLHRGTAHLRELVRKIVPRQPRAAPDTRRDVAPSGAQGAVSGTFEFPSAAFPCSLLPPLVPEYVRIPNVFTSALNTRLNTRIHLPTPAYCPCRDETCRPLFVFYRVRAFLVSSRVRAVFTRFTHEVDWLARNPEQTRHISMVWS